jgi:hypothetical protein
MLMLFTAQGIKNFEIELALAFSMLWGGCGHDTVAHSTALQSQTRPQLDTKINM